MNPLRILMTNYALESRAGTELYVRDVARALRRMGHLPAVYSPVHGVVAEEIRADGIQVVDDVGELDATPDIIHAHHTLPTLAALIRFPGVPAIYVQHDRLAWVDLPPRHPRIRLYVAVDENCLERLTVEAGIPREMTRVILNAVDLERFRPRDPLPVTPRRALVFSNYANEDTVVAKVRVACDRAGVSLDALGNGVGRVCERPEEVLGQYDIVFAKARCALEAMAVGCAVITCDVRGVGGLVTPTRWDSYRRLNFGMKSLLDPVSPDVLTREIALYNPADAATISRRTREEASLEGQVASFVGLYREVLALPGVSGDESGATARLMRDLLRPWQESWRISIERQQSLDLQRRAEEAAQAVRAELERARSDLTASQAREKELAAALAGAEAALQEEAARLGALSHALQNSAAIRLRDRVNGVPVLRPVARALVRWAAGKKPS